MVRIITTKSSVWSIDEDAKEFNRSPRNPDFDHPNVAYTGIWQPYESISETEIDDDRVAFSVITPNIMDSLHSQYRKSEQ